MTNSIYELFGALSPQQINIKLYFQEKEQILETYLGHWKKSKFIETHQIEKEQTWRFILKNRQILLTNSKFLCTYNIQKQQLF